MQENEKHEDNAREPERIRYRLEDGIFMDYLLTDQHIFFVKQLSATLIASLSIVLALLLTILLTITNIVPIDGNAAVLPLLWIGDLILFGLILYFAVFKPMALRRRSNLLKILHEQDAISSLGKAHHDAIRWSDVKEAQLKGKRLFITYGHNVRIRGDLREWERKGENAMGVVASSNQIESIQNFLKIKLGDKFKVM